jgi:hypothetical protein
MPIMAAVQSGFSLAPLRIIKQINKYYLSKHALAAGLRHSEKRISYRCNGTLFTAFKLLKYFPMLQ